MRPFFFSSVVWCFLFSKLRMSNGFQHPILSGTRAYSRNTLCMKKLATSDGRGTRLKSLAHIYKPKSINQQQYVSFLESKNVDIVFGIGPAGTNTVGKYPNRNDPIMSPGTILSQIPRLRIASNIR